MATTSDEPADRLWAAALDEMQGRMARGTFEKWLKGSRVVDSGEGTLTIGILSMQGAEWLQHRLRGVIERTVQDVAGRPIAVSFVWSCFGQEQEQENDAHEEEEEGPENGEQQDDKAALPEPALHQGNVPAKKLSPAHFYIRIRTAIRERAVRELIGPPLAVFLILATHLGGDGVAAPGIETIMRETGYSRRAVCSALAKLLDLGLVSKRGSRQHAVAYAVNAYAWFGSGEAPALWED